MATRVNGDETVVDPGRMPDEYVKNGWWRHLILIAMSVVMTIPFIWMVLTSLKPLGEVALMNPVPRHWQPENYLEVFREIPFGLYYFNSIFVAAWTTFLTVLTSAFAGYAFARLQWRGRDTVFKLYLATMMIPGVVTLVPNFAIMVKLHLLDTYSGLIIPGAFTAYGTFLMRQFMMTIPRALDESAGIDGASKFTVFWDIILPLSRAGLITLAIFSFMGSYGSFLWPLIMIKSEQLRTLPIGMLFFSSTNGQETNLLMAASVMNILPLIILFLCTQKYLVKGIQLGAVKG